MNNDRTRKARKRVSMKDRIKYRCNVFANKTADGRKERAKIKAAFEAGARFVENDIKSRYILEPIQMK